ncbi:ABC transporter permease subunit [Neisseria leonii]|uniref:Glutamate/aspartate import permease protein GltK n=1 Tax=Neisseria leonii TaxID=2995413 RepID=A0A9X4IAA8_9NEIS|nr:MULTISPECIES: ABC transporter permease subunit [unclassified Neisseria]MDD9325239.1 ABC transporter permease subunit [Neisseria sp. 3986]MDD9327205.1 ABC transporter permease subunit [Neisseria sp. 51.81]
MFGLNMGELSAAMPGLMQGLGITLKLLAFGVIGGIVLGTLLALARLSKFGWLSFLAKTYVNYFRSVPLLLVLIWFYYAVPMMYSLITGSYLTINVAFASCAVAFMLFEAAYFSEVVRAGIQSISKGQFHAAYALGMTYRQTMRLVILPQAFRKMLPLILQQSIILFQDTTLVAAIGLVDFFRANYVRGDLMNLLTPYILLAGAVYFVISAAAMAGVKKLQQRLKV